MTTDADRLTRLEAIAEITATGLETLQRGQEALRGEMQRGQEGLRGEIQNLRAEMQHGQEGLRGEMASNLRIILVAIFGGAITMFVTVVGAFLGLYFA